jgi:hypothetical protein
MFYEPVPIVPSVTGATAGEIFNQYSIDDSQLNDILALSHNAPLRSSVGGPIRLNTQLQGDLVLPIDITVHITTAVPRVDMINGLRPVRVVNGVPDRSSVKPFTHGVDVQLSRIGHACKRLRWVQTVKKRNNPDETQPSEFVDIGGNGFPWYNGTAPLDSSVFDDTPCGPASPGPHLGLEWSGTVSITVWTMERITIAKAFTYGFKILPGTTIASVQWNPQVRPATEAEIREHIRILEAGINQFRQSTGGRLIYTPPPADGAVNTDVLFGRF